MLARMRTHISTVTALTPNPSPKGRGGRNSLSRRERDYPTSQRLKNAA
jgi:hypothetical protein